MQRVQRQFRVQIMWTGVALALWSAPLFRQMSLFLIPVVLMQMELRHFLLPRRVKFMEAGPTEQGQGTDQGPDRQSLSRLGLGHALLCMLVIGVQGSRVTPYAWALAAVSAVLLWWLEQRRLNAPSTEI